LSELLAFVVDNYDLLIEDEDKQNILKELKNYFPHLVLSKSNSSGEEFYMEDFEQARKTLSFPKTLPEYVERKDGTKKVATKE
jgi:hypothetical protein